ncbi:MAG: hypothetical protein ACF8R7_10075 [Phycisphaerales bacterium JB039]
MRTTGIVCAAALLTLVGACEERRGSSDQGKATPDLANGANNSVGERGDASTILPSAEALGIQGWQDTVHVRGERTELRPETLYRGIGELNSLASSRPELSVIPSEHGGHHLTGPIEPGDLDAIMGVFASAEVSADKMSSAPPTSEIRSLGQMAAAAVQLVSLEPSASALVGSEAPPAVKSRLERAGSAWPEAARVWRVIGMPPDADERASVSFAPDNDPEDDQDEARHRRLQAMGILEFAPVEGGGPGDLITASVGFPYQNRDQLDCELALKFVFDRETEQWVLYSIGSNPGNATMRRLAAAGEWDRISSVAHQLDLLSVLPDCHIVVGARGPLLCRGP